MPYANTMGHEYAYDDVGIIQQNRFIQQDIAGIPDLLKTSYWYGNGETNQGAYRPLSMIAFAVEQELAPGKPHVGHFVNVVLYSLTAVHLFGVLCRLLRGCSIYVPFIAALVFVAHPLHSEVVANIKSRTALLCIFFLYLRPGCCLPMTGQKKPRPSCFQRLRIFCVFFHVKNDWSFLPYFRCFCNFYRCGLEGLPETSLRTWRKRRIFICIHQYVIARELATKITCNYFDNVLLAAPDSASRLATTVYIFENYLRPAESAGWA
jgi:protein O-mannosyl-transferase